jgi:hypothetical protein
MMTDPHDAPGTDTPPVITLSTRRVDDIADLLECCDQFLRQASEDTHAELRAFLAQHPTRHELGWLIDMLGFDALFLRAKLTVAAETAATRQQVSR